MPKMLKTKKYRILQTKCNNIENNDEQDQNYLFHLRKKKREKETVHNESYHLMKMQKEEELHNLKIQNQMLQNEKLQVEIRLLQKQLNM